MSDAESMSLKARLNNMAKKLRLRPQTVIQNYMFERFLERLSSCPLRDNFVIKGGLLISSMIGLEARATMDMDATILGIPLRMGDVRKAVTRICNVAVDDGVKFVVLGLERIRIDVEGYGGIRVKLEAKFHGMRVPCAIDVTAGDAMTIVRYSYRSRFLAGRSFLLRTYAKETVLAEKCEAILKRNVIGTRPRDYYDVHVLTHLYKINPVKFRKALKSTFAACGTSVLLDNMPTILDEIAKSSLLLEHWRRFQIEFPYARGIEFIETVKTVRELLNGRSESRST